MSFRKNSENFQINTSTLLVMQRFLKVKFSDKLLCFIYFYFLWLINMNCIKITLLLLVFTFQCKNNLNAQHKNNFEAGVFNIGFGALSGGLGAIINKKSNEKTGKVFLKGLAQGALGGYLLFESKRLVNTFYRTEDYIYVWPSKLVNSAATSIMENAAANRNFWERWHINIGFNRFEFYTKDKFKMTYRIMPFALGSTIYGFTQGKLAIYSSLKTGTFVFAAENLNENNGPEGIAAANIIIYQKNSEFLKSSIIAHELIHNYQYESFSVLNTYINKSVLYLESKKNVFEKYNKLFYTDFNYLSDGLFSLTSKSFIENEAEFYAE